MFILYFLQDEAGEDPNVPNCLEIRTAGRALLCDLQTAFPIKDGSLFHFRCRVDDSNCGFVWQDMTDPSESLPLSDGCVFVKVKTSFYFIFIVSAPLAYSDRYYEPPSYKALSLLNWCTGPASQQAGASGVAPQAQSWRKS
jgi:hypothetical protein